jgi:hypothetical protein
MSPSSANIPSPPKAPQAALRERLAQLAAALLETRGRVVRSFDRELASLRSWMDSLDQFDPTVGLKVIHEPSPASSVAMFEQLISDPPSPAAHNIVPFSLPTFMESREAAVEEQPLDPAFASATIDELNEALSAAFQHVAHKRPADERRSA